MKINKKQIGLCIVMFISSFLLIFFFSFSLLVCLKEFSLVAKKAILAISLCFTSAFSLLCTIWFAFRLNSSRMSKLGNWLAMNWPTLILYYTFALIFMVSIRSEAVWNQIEMREMVVLQWTMFGISTAVFLVWHVLLSSYIKENPWSQNEKETLLFQQINLIKKSDYHQKICSLFNSISLMSANLFTLLIATASMYLLKSELPVLKENLVRFSFYLCTNTLVELFIDIIRPLSEEKKKALNSSKVTNAEIDRYNDFEDKLERTFYMLKELEQLSSLTDEEKQKVKLELLHPLLGDVISNERQTTKEN